MRDGLRHEYKFLLSAAGAELLRARLPAIIRRDSHSGKDGKYSIRSLYFDDPSYSAYEEKLAGVDERTKYRIRCYNGDMSLVNLERKERHGDLSRKLIQPLSYSQAETLARGERPVEAEGLLSQLCRDMAGRGLRPRVLVDYERSPFVCPDGNTRVTLDENLRTAPYFPDFASPAGRMIPVTEPGQVILEIKYDDFLPGYLADAISDVPKDKIAVSKFALCAELL